jgi:copper homeostasis protein
MTPNYLVEVAAGSLHSCLEAQRGGAGRVELCSALSTDGLTPSPAQIEFARKYLHIPLFILIRPREGDFVYDSLEHDLMLREIEMACNAGADGIVTGALHMDGTVNTEQTSRLVQAAHPLPLTFHRAVDVCTDPLAALESIISAGCKRILTSGGKLTAVEGKKTIHQMVDCAKDRIIICPGGRIDASHIEELMTDGITEFHLSGRVEMKSSLKSALYQMDYTETDHALVKEFVDQLTRTGLNGQAH